MKATPPIGEPREEERGAEGIATRRLCSVELYHVKKRRWTMVSFYPSPPFICQEAKLMGSSN